MSEEEPKPEETTPASSEETTPAAASSEETTPAAASSEEEKQEEKKEEQPHGSAIVCDPGYLPPPFQNAETCAKSGKEFSFFNRRHHCRNCGQSFSSEFVSTRVDLPRFQMKSVLVCDPCAKSLSEQKGWAQDPDTLVPEWPEGYDNTTCDPAGELEIRKSQKGIASLEPFTVMEAFQKAVKANPEAHALRFQVDGKWQHKTYQQYYDETLTVAKALVQLGMKPFESVNIIGFNSPEWLLANMGAIAAGGKAAGIYTTNGPEACQYISEHSQARVVAVENQKQLEKFLQIRDSLNLLAIVMWDGKVPEDANVEGKTTVYDWATFMKLGQDASEEVAKEVEKRIADQRPGHGCTLIYTSGTTGNPKAVQVSHDNLTWTTTSFLSLTPEIGNGQAEDRVISYLPLSHIAAQVLDIHMPLVVGATSGGVVTVSFALPTALKGTLLQTLNDVKPTIFFGVPRVWEKFAEALKAKGAGTTGLKKAISDFAKGQGLARFRDTQLGGSGSDPLFIGLAESLVFNKVKTALGLNECKLCYTGAAPISKDTLEYWGSLGIHVLELYGMSENTGPQNSCIPTQRVTGGCGRALPGCEIWIDHQPDRDAKGEGEICFRGRHIMMGYMNDPEKTKGAIDPKGFLHSGDVGRVDENGILYITGRIKELIITAGGENVAPVPVEEKVKLHCPAISGCMMVGDKRKYNTMLVALRHELNEDGTLSDNLDKVSLAISPESKTISEAMQDPKWKAYIEAGIKEANKSSVSNASKIQKFRIIPADFTVEGGELTATQKLKRPVVMTKYHDLIEEMYNEKAPAAAKQEGKEQAQAEPQEKEIPKE